jgi:hypothetical protein
MGEIRRGGESGNCNKMVETVLYLLGWAEFGTVRLDRT